MGTMVNPKTFSTTYRSVREGFRVANSKIFPQIATENASATQGLNNLKARRWLQTSISNPEHATDVIKAYSSDSAFLEGALYTKDKLISLVKYLEKRNVHVYGIIEEPCFIARRQGVNHIYLTENPTILEVKHELSHWLDYKKLGFEEYSKLSRYQREELVL